MDHTILLLSHEQRQVDNNLFNSLIYRHMVLSFFDSHYEPEDLPPGTEITTPERKREYQNSNHSCKGHCRKKDRSLSC
jgi:hypothetical protein